MGERQKESTAVKSVVGKGEGEAQAVIYQHSRFGKWRGAGLNEEEREEQLPGERLVAARVWKAEVSSTKVYRPYYLPLAWPADQSLQPPDYPRSPSDFH